MWLTAVLANQCDRLPVWLTGAVADGAFLTEGSRSPSVVTHTLAAHTLSPAAANQAVVWHAALGGDGTVAGLTRPARETHTFPRNTPAESWTVIKIHLYDVYTSTNVSIPEILLLFKTIHIFYTFIIHKMRILVPFIVRYLFHSIIQK